MVRTLGMCGAWYGSRLFWGGLLGFAFLLFVWAYRLESPVDYWAGGLDVEGRVGVGQGRVWVGWDVSNPRDPFSGTRKGFGVNKLNDSFVEAKGWGVPALETSSNVFEPGGWQVTIGYWVLVVVYLVLWLGALVLWQRRKRKLAGPVVGRIGWKRIAIPVVGMVAMAVAMTRREEKLPITWAYAFRGSAREVWTLLNEDGVVTAEEIIELCYRGGSLHDGDRQYKTAFALLGHSDDPVPALRRMMGEAAPERRAFAALTAGNLGDARLRPDLEKLKGDGATLGSFPGDWFWDTVGDAAEKALGRLDSGGIVNAVLDPKDQRRFSPWLQRAEIRE